MKPEAKEIPFEVLPPEEKERRRAVEPLFRVVALFMDNLLRVPGTKFRFGLNPLIDLIPGIGDVSAAFVSTSVLVYALRHGIPKVLLARMGLNVLINEAVGIIPVVGSAFALWFRCNQRNYDLLRTHAQEPRARRTSDWIFVGVVLAAVVFVIFGATTATILLLHAIAVGISGR